MKISHSNTPVYQPNFYPQINFPSQAFSLQDKTIRGDVQTLETTLFLEKANVPLCVGEAADARTPMYFTDQ
jgi:hypothetical protein